MPNAVVGSTNPPSAGLMRVTTLAGLSILLASTLVAQELLLFQRQVIPTVAAGGPPVVRSFPDTVRVLALMVDFQPDTDPRTSGTGRFMLQPIAAQRIDPPPHDSSYFASKLLFLENYFRKVSNGKQIVKGEVFGRVVTLSKQMSAYSPPARGGEDRRLADLVIESWRTADSLYPWIDFARYDAFIIFHAGVGRNIDLVSILGFDPTPSDIPSLFISLPTLRTFLNNPAYRGIPVKGGSFHITNTMILPETQSREIQSGGNTVLLQLSINGLLASSMGSYLGLPDLFNTKTGRSGIGQFGLMDVASIFAYNGLFPPEPSAWEKMYLGWLTPITVHAAAQTITLPAVGLTSVGEDTVYKVPISAREYFLVENRNRDPHGNGQRLTFIRNGMPATQHFGRDTTGFRYNNTDAAWGWLVDVEDFDWALLGVKGEADGTLEGGGILIWHIDEEVIERTLALNAVNADPKRRGVALKEADGANDIGQVYGLFNPGLGSELGSPYDCWFETNPSRVYTNTFGPSTFPNSNSNSGARSLVRISNFSKRSPRMTARVEVGDTQVQTIPALSRTFASTRVSHVTVGRSGIFFGAGDSVYAVAFSGTSKTAHQSGLLAPSGGRMGVAVFDRSDRSALLAGAQGSTAYIWHVEDHTGDGVYDAVREVSVPLGRRVTTAPVIRDDGVKTVVVVGGEEGTVWTLDTEGRLENTLRVSQHAVTSLALMSTPGLTRQNALYFASGNQLNSEQAGTLVGGEQVRWRIAVAGSGANAFVAAAEIGGERVVAYDPSLGRQLFFNTFPGAAFSTMVIGDLDTDGRKDLVLSSGNRLYVLNRSGLVMDGFPVRLDEGDEFVGSPLVVDLDGDNAADVVSMTKRGLVVAYSSRGEIKNGFPVQATARGDGFVAAFRTQNNRIGLAAISTAGELRALELNTPYNASRIIWGQHLHDAQHSNADPSETVAPAERYSTFLPPTSVYSWPNPVHEGLANIRFYVSEDANVTVRIYDLAGLKITEFKTRAVGGIDNEVAWDIVDIQSGVYFAHVEAVSRSQTARAIIKVAVVK